MAKSQDEQGMENILTFEGSNFFRLRIIMSTLSGCPVRIKNIRDKEDNLGLSDYEVSFIRLIDQLTNGSTIIVSDTGTKLFYQPGILLGGNIEHDCNPSRSIGYYLEAIMCLAPFSKSPMKLRLRGVTNDQVDPSVDMLKFASLPVLSKFLGVTEGLELKVLRRGAAPEGGGEVFFASPTKQKLRPCQLWECGKVKKIRGIAWAARVSPATCNRVVEACRGVLNQFIPDIYISTEHLRGNQSGKSPGFGLTLVAETTTGVFLCAEKSSNAKGSSQGPTVPEDLGKNTAHLLLEEVFRGGCASSSAQGLACLLMTLGDKDVSKLRLGPLSMYTVEVLRHIKTFFGVTFKLEVEKNPEEYLRLGSDKIILTCVGMGFRNLSKVVM